MTTDLAPNQPVFFRKQPKGPDTAPDAQFIRTVAELNGQSVIEVLYRSEKWKCRRSDVRIPSVAFSDLARQWHQEINLQIAAGKHKRDQQAKALGVSLTTLRKRLRFIQNHLPKTP